MARRRINQDLNEDGPFNRLYADLRGAVWETQGKGASWEGFASKANLSPSTVKKFAYGDTQRPHWRTASAMAAACELRFALVPAVTPTLPGEVQMTPAQRGALTRKMKKK